ncbi:hypothetical protein MKW92_024747 [Papaver armeniacum]|nr:hypothetical protein MKW92_024747 [Papaver armeniacum]
MGEKGNCGRRSGTAASNVCFDILSYGIPSSPGSQFTGFDILSYGIPASCKISFLMDLLSAFSCSFYSSGKLSTVITRALLTLVQGLETKLMPWHVFHGLHL